GVIKKTNAVAINNQEISAVLYLPASLKLAREGTNNARTAIVIKIIKGADLLKLTFFIIN
ncbi:MAG: hypothetical protein ACTHNG_08145, partial [Ginsengibacter sp.]